MDMLFNYLANFFEGVLLRLPPSSDMGSLAREVFNGSFA
jgi:hypothetical protein